MKMAKVATAAVEAVMKMAKVATAAVEAVMKMATNAADAVARTATRTRNQGGVVHFGYTMKVLSPTTGDSFIVAAEWTDDDEDMDHMLAEVSFLIAAASCIGPDDFGYAFMGHGNNAGTADVILRSGHPPLLEIKDKILKWLAENGPHLGERYCAYTLEAQ